jgi:hypothetical protein
MLKPHRFLETAARREALRRAICRANCRAKEPRPQPVSLCEAALAYSLIAVACAVGMLCGRLAFVYVWAIAR